MYISKETFSIFQQRLNSNDFEAFGFLSDTLENLDAIDRTYSRPLRCLLTSILELSMSADNEEINFSDIADAYNHIRNLICELVCKQQNIYAAYTPELGTTVIFQNKIEKDGTCTSTTVIGFYFGEPNYVDTTIYAHETTAKF
jgi:hypothetical protein